MLNINKSCGKSLRHRTSSKYFSTTEYTYLFIYIITSLLTYILSYLLNVWRRVLLEKLTGPQLVKKFSAFYGTCWFITLFTNARKLSLSWARSVQSMPLHPTPWRTLLILTSHLRLRVAPLPHVSPSMSSIHHSSSPIRATCTAHPILFDLITRTILGEN